MEDVKISTDLLIGLLLGIAVPYLIYCLRMFSMTKQMRNGLLEQAEHGFGSEHTRALLQENLEALAEYHRESTKSTTALRYAFKELSHFMKWMVKERTGKEPPPYVREE